MNRLLALGEALKKTVKLDRVYFINGTAYAGKSTMVRLLSEKYDGIACEENYHDRLVAELSKEEFPCLTYMRDLKDWSDFIRRTPDEYEAWFDGCTIECAILELRILEELTKNQDKMIFVDTNLPLKLLKLISDEQHVVIMLADPGVSVSRFFDRPDREKQFLYSLLQKEPDPSAAMENFRQCMSRINSPERYNTFKNSGFSVILRDEGRTKEQTLALVEQSLGLYP